VFTNLGQEIQKYFSLCLVIQSFLFGRKDLILLWFEQGLITLRTFGVTTPWSEMCLFSVRIKIWIHSFLVALRVNFPPPLPGQQARRGAGIRPISYHTNFFFTQHHRSVWLTLILKCSVDGKFLIINFYCRGNHFPLQ